MANKRHPHDVRHPHQGRSLTFHRLLDKLVERGHRHDPTWQKQWREAVLNNEDRFGRFLEGYNAKKKQEILAAIEPTKRKYWICLLNLETAKGGNVSRFLLDPATHKEGETPKNESYDGLSFSHIRDASEILSTYFDYVDKTRLPLFEDKKTWTRVLNDALVKVTAELEEGFSADDHWLPTSNVTISAPACFAGRDACLADIDTVFERHENRIVIVALHGLRGVGKSLAAAVYAHDHRKEFRATWWLSCTSDQAIRSGLLELAARLRWVTPDVGEELAIAATLNKLGDAADEILLIFDDAPDLQAIKPYLPNSGRCRVLVTTNSDVWRGHATVIEVGPWTDQTAADFLIARTPPPQSRAEAESLVTEFGGLPLALEMAAAYCEEKGTGFAEFHKLLHRQKVTFLDNAKYAPDEYNQRRTVVRTFALAIDGANALHPAAESLLTCCALLAPEPVPLYLFSQGQDVYGEPLGSAIPTGELDDIVAALRKFSLVTRERLPGGDDAPMPSDALRMHQLISEVAVSRHSAERLKQLRREVFVAIFRIFPSDGDVNPKSWHVCDQLTAPVALLRNCAPETFANADEWGRLLDKLASYLRGRGSYDFAEKVMREAVAMQETTFGKSHIATVTAYNGLAHVLRQKGNYSEAYELMERVYEFGQSVWRDEHPSMVVTLESLGNLLRHLGRVAEAYPMLRRALEMSINLDKRDAVMCNCVGSLAALLQQIGCYTEAMELYKRQEEIIKETGGPASLALAICHNNIGNIYFENGMLPDAKSRYELSLHTMEDAVGKNHPEIVPCLQNLGILLMKEGNYDEANVVLIRAQIVSSHYYGLTNINTARVLESLSLLSWKRGEANWRQKNLLVVDLFESNLGKDHPETVRVRQGRHAMILRARLRRILLGSLALAVAIWLIWLNNLKKHHIPPGESTNHPAISKIPS